MLGTRGKRDSQGFIKYRFLIFVVSIGMIGAFLKPNSSLAEAVEIPQLFLEANQAYEKGNYKTSAALYENIITFGIHSGMIYYNLGNCYARLGEIGKALLNYRRAERLIPRDGDLKFNMQYVLDQRKDKIEPKDKVPFAKAFFFWYFWLSMKELLFIFLIVNVLFWLVALVLLYKQYDVFRWIRILTLCLLFIFGPSLGVKLYSQKILHHGVVIKPEATIRSGNGPNHSPLFILHEGAEFSINQENNGWIKIRLADGKIGWVSLSAVQII
jgi:tetratricopeptide (TPR) repeat protein